jgi:hypothetical protein
MWTFGHLTFNSDLVLGDCHLVLCSIHYHILVIICAMIMLKLFISLSYTAGKKCETFDI